VEKRSTGEAIKFIAVTVAEIHSTIVKAERTDS
jgi:uncharacterized protein YoaH (UPF0181 family)